MPLPIGVQTVARLEKIGTIVPSTINTTYDLPTQGGLIPSGRWIHSLILEVKLRLTNPGTGQPTGVLADAPYGLINELRVTGFHRPRTEEHRLIRLRGADLAELNRIYFSNPPHSEPATLSVSASAANDIRFLIEVPFVPLKLPLRQQLGWLLDAPNYENLRLEIDWADTNSVFSGQSTQPTISAFGSGSGNPAVNVAGRFVIAGATKLKGFVPGRVFRYYRENTQDLTASGNDKRLFDVPRGHFIRSVLIKTGVKHTAASGGNDVYATLSDAILDEIRFNRGINNAIRSAQTWHILRNESNFAFAQLPSAGYAPIEFAPNGIDLEILDARNLVAGPDGTVDLNIEADVTGAANTAAVFVVEEWRHAPFNFTSNRR